MFNNQIIAGSSGQAGGFYSYSIDQSLRFDGSSSTLHRTPSAAGNQRTWTWSCWFKRSVLNTYQNLFGTDYNTSGNYGGYIAILDTNKLRVYSNLSGSVQMHIDVDMLFRDVSSFYHLTVVFDSTEATAGDRVKVYVNGSLVTYTTTTAPALNLQGQLNDGERHDIGSFYVNNSPTWHWNGYMAEVNFIDGTALDATSFGETINGVWVPKAYSGSYGTNGFYLSFADSAAIGDDLSGNTNDFTATNLAASDVVPDSPTNNWCTFNPLDQNDVSGLTYPTTYSEGNLKVTQGTGFINRKATFGMTGGKWYWEIKINDGSPDSFFGVSKSTGDARGALDNDEATIRLTNGDLYTNGATSSYGTAFSNGDVCILAVDMDAGKFWAGRNGTWFASGDPAAGTNEGKSGLASELFPSVSLADAENCDVNFGQNGTFNGTKTAGGNSDGNGYGDFLYTVPSGFLALNSANLPEPAIGPNSTTTSDEYFDTILYTAATSNGTYTHGNLAFRPDFSWIKNRNNAERHFLTDVVRGNTSVTDKFLVSSATSAEGANGVSGTTFSVTDTGYEFVETSITSGELYYNGRTYVGWNWKAGGAAVSNTSGSITSSVSANQDAGFSIVSYTGTGANATVGHGLAETPEIVIVKNRDYGSGFWATWTKFNTNDTILGLDLTNGLFSSPGSFIEGDINDTTIGVGTERVANGSTERMIAYCFHSVDGFSKVGSYVGNGNADGTFIFTGHRVKWLMVKRLTSGAGWSIFDDTRNAYNPSDAILQANTANAEGTSYPMDFVSNGVKIRNSDSTHNQSGVSYIYLAFAEAPFKYANAR